LVVSLVLGVGELKRVLNEWAIRFCYSTSMIMLKFRSNSNNKKESRSQKAQCAFNNGNQWTSDPIACLDVKDLKD